MTHKRQALGHAKVGAVRDCVIARSGDTVRGHEYHYSTALVDRDARFAYRTTKGDGIDGCDGIVEEQRFSVMSPYARLLDAARV